MTTTHGEAPVCLVTGATKGIGRATAAGLARAGAHVIVAGRSQERTADTVRQLASATGSDRLEGVVGDLSVQSEVRSLAAQVMARHDRLDVLINNAGMGGTHRVLSPDCVESVWAVNHLAPFLLTGLLLDLLRAGAPSRVVTVTSALQGCARLDLDDPEFTRRPYRPLAAYAQAKLAQVVFTLELAERLRGTGVTVNCVHPGLARTGIARQFGTRGAVGRGMRLRDLLSSGPDRAARAPIHLATAPDLAGVTGEYFVNRKRGTPRPGRVNRVARDVGARRRLWDMSAEMTGLAPGPLVLWTR
ncbi:SDR family NAD(P)-dependent oxidoreductase [Streptomyces litchfieldiae]|uniref:SDR family NAD(P)-dependent oxidoreductase n=1 Tax=Streptomyces litchfieldiae TaxID=3075543 RepID=A0ABU2MM05_9ACTN|nr:SDR family NAD(P)-dependent oxidoreductase [Streptomyces sp. DSM 44938]MDT0342634.1 SDR family NAD(P)-dependent oxidoreductase [Streptomyces sp. DSM 44938]